MSDDTQKQTLSRRDQIAAQTLAAMIVKYGMHDDVCEHSIEMTDDLIKLLDKPSEAEEK
ncbi:MAG: hypothetical protein ACTIJH_06400 [Moraxellaceae bacterium]